jgi:4-carboxymuconolactone decarboxylase
MTPGWDAAGERQYAGLAVAAASGRVLASHPIHTPPNENRRNPMAQSQPASARDAVRNVVPDLIGYTEKWLFGEVWERPQLSKRDRSLIVVATLIALGREKQLVGHLERALNNGLTKTELSEVITHLAFYAGWPAAMTAALVAKDVFEKVG